MSIYLYLEKNTFVHRLNPISKIFALLYFFLILLLFSKILPLLTVGLFIFLIALFAQALGNLKRIWALMLILTIFTVILWTIFSHEKTIVQRFVYALAMALRLNLLIFSGLIFLSVTRIEEFTAGLNKLGLPFPVCFALTLAFRLVPTFILSAETTLQAQKSRGLDLESGNLIQKIKKHLPLIIPILTTTLRNVELLAIALEAKGFGAKKRRTYYLDFKFGRNDLLTLFLLAFLFFFVFTAFH